MRIDNKGRRVVRVAVRAADIPVQPLPISTPFIRLDAALKLCGIAQTGGHAKLLIQEEQSVYVNNERCTMRGKKLYPGDRFRYERQWFEVRTA